MDNDQIKQQIESAKRAFIASKTYPRQDSMAGDSATHDDHITETKTQKDIGCIHLVKMLVNGKNLRVRALLV